MKKDEHIINAINEFYEIPRVSLFDDFFIEKDEDSFLECSSRIAALVDGKNIVPDEDGVPENFELTKAGIEKAWYILTDYVPHNDLVDITHKMSKEDNLAKSIHRWETSVKEAPIPVLIYFCIHGAECRRIYFSELKNRLRALM